ncbi:FAD-dependent monooxygenase [Chloroflexi bacterium TSY]|nr:FAD-dependent monooxygenase [Chloroflexi bacterium TSY]
MTTNKKVLISGAGIAGLTVAYWLQKFGFTPVIVEKRPDLSDRGYMIDFYGSGFDVAEKMGLIEALRLRTAQYPISKLSFVDNHGNTRAHLDVDRIRKLLHGRFLSLMRGDLASVLYESVKDLIPVHFNTSIKGLHPHPDGVDVDLSNGEEQRFDLVIGADGIHSCVRYLLWGDEDQFENFLGFYVACSVIDNFLEQPDACFGHFEPNVQVMVYSIGENKLTAFFAFKSERLALKGRQAQHEMLGKVFGHRGWIAPQLAKATEESPELFFDAVSQIKLNSWHNDRVVLVGDACQCLTLLAGQGASMGMAGAYLLANELQRANGDYQTAFPAYQAKLKPEIQRRQQAAQKLANSFVPANQLSIYLTYLFLKMAFLPGFRSLFIQQIGARSIIK